MRSPPAFTPGFGWAAPGRFVALLLVTSLLGAGAVTLDAPPAEAQVPGARAAGVDEEGPWRLTEEPILSVGAALAPEHEVFGDLVDVVRLSSGVVVTADRLSGELRFFGPDGRLVRRRGGRGEGPREFINIIAMERCRGDSLVVLDARRRYLPVRSPDGTFARTIDLTGLPSDGFGHPPPELISCNDRGTLALAGESLPSPSSLEGGPLRTSFSVVLLGPDGTVRNVGDFPGDERYVHLRRSGSRPAGSVGPRPFGKRLSVALGDSLAYVGTGDAFEIAVFSLDGERVGTVSDTVSRVELTEERLDEYAAEIASRAEDGEERLRELRERYTSLDLPEAAPAHGDMLVGEGGHLWVQEYPGPGEPPRWRIYAPGGERVAVLTLPRRFDLRAAGLDGGGTDYALGIWRDEADVEHVRMYGVVGGG